MKVLIGERRKKKTGSRKKTHRAVRYLMLTVMLSVLLGVIALAGNAAAANVDPYGRSIRNVKDNELVKVSAAQTPDGRWLNTENGRRFVLRDETVVKNGFIKANNQIYCLDKNGQKVLGWIRYRDKMYYAGKTGALKKGWLKEKEQKYYFGSDYSMQTGLKTINKAKYYFDKDGARYSGWVKIGSNSYYFNFSNGRMAKAAWIRTDGKYYYVRSNGKKKKPGWMTLDGKKYYLDADGARVTGTVQIKEKWYWFDKQGVYDSTVKVDVPDPNRPMIALTFDDGPGPYTNRLLDCLERNHAKATFFMVGSSVSGYGSAVARMARIGCELGNHSWSHPRYTSLSVSGIQSQISSTGSAIRNASGKSPTVCRMPYGDGAWTSWVQSAVGLPSIYWSIDTRDWANTGNPQHTINEVLNTVKSGDIVLMHDIHYSSVVAAETIIPTLISRGYQLVTVSELAKYKGGTALSSGRTYRSF